jgi:hypothetical protein
MNDVTAVPSDQTSPPPSPSSSRSKAEGRSVRIEGEDKEGEGKEGEGIEGEGEAAKISGTHKNNLFINDLYFVTKNGALESVPSKTMNWILNKISSEIEFDEEFSDREALENLRLRVLDKYPFRLSTYELIQIYGKYDLNNQLYVVSNDKK